MNAKVVKLLLLLVAFTSSNGRLYRTIRTNEAREKAAEDHSLSRFIGSKRAVGDEIEQMADIVHTDERRKLPSCRGLVENIVRYLNDQSDTGLARTICSGLGCGCETFSGRCRRCVCNSNYRCLAHQSGTQN